MNYPRHVKHVRVDEVQREPLRMPAWLARVFNRHNQADMYGGAAQAAYCPPQ